MGVAFMGVPPFPAAEICCRICFISPAMDCLGLYSCLGLYMNSWVCLGLYIETMGRREGRRGRRLDKGDFSLLVREAREFFREVEGDVSLEVVPGGPGGA